MYNTTINPLNIVYRKPPKSQETKNQGAQQTEDEKNPLQERRKNTYTEINPVNYNAKINYTNVNNTVNIAQIVTDFRNTNAAINAPAEIQEEVDLYLSLVERESLKDNPQRSIILSNLKNASRISDKYIADTLKKPSNVVEGWIDALFAQNVVLKSDPTQINEVFQIKLPNKKQEAKTPKVSEAPQAAEISEVKEEKAEVIEKKVQEAEIKKPSPFKKSSEYYENATPELKQTFQSARKISKDNPADALSQYDEALLIAGANNDAAFEGAIHFEKGKIFDEYDYIPHALSEYEKATESPDENLKSNAHLKMAKIYEDYVKFEPAVDHYHQAIAYFGEANNPKGQTAAVKGLSSMFAQRFDKKYTEIFNHLTIDSAKECHDNKILADALSGVAKNYEYIGENQKALEHYKYAAKTYSANEESAYEVGQNYLDASKLMRKLGNDAKADSLLRKAHQYFGLTEQAQNQWA